MYRSRFIRIFISSTFDDMELERNILQQVVFPNLTQYCNSRGWQFEDVDLRWGINNEASLDQRTMQICMEELRACQTMSPRPNFLILQGDRYGWIPLPEVLSRAQGERIRSVAKAEERALFDRWYKLDTNRSVNVGGSWILQPRGDEYAQWDYYQKQVEIPLRKLFEREGEAWMNQSATEQEIWAGAFSQPDAGEHVVLYDRHLKNVPKEHLLKYSEKWSLSSISGYQRVNKLRQHESRLIHHTMRKTLAFDNLETDKYASWFADSIEVLLKAVIEREIDHYEAIREEEIVKFNAEEYIAHSKRILVGRSEEIKELTAFSGGSVIYLVGPSGSGLSTLSASFVNGKNHIYCSAGITHLSGNGSDMLRSVWERLGGAESDEPFSYRALSTLLSSYDGPDVWIVIDGIYHLDANDDIRREIWHPNRLSSRITLIITTDYKMWVPSAYTLDALIVTIASFSIPEAEQYLLNSLKVSDSCVTDNQYQFILELLNDNRELCPRYLNLLLADILCWHSYDTRLPLRYSGEMQQYLDSIFRQNGIRLSKTSLALLSASQYGISIQELRSFLMLDDAYLEEFNKKSHHKLYGNLAPSILCARLMRDLSPYIQQAAVFDTFLSRISNPAFREVIQNSIENFEERVFEFYDHRWREGDTHALFEIGNIACHLNNKAHATRLFCDLEYCIAKLSKDCSSRLRPQMSAFLKRNPGIRDFLLFDADAEDYLRNHSGMDARTVVLRLAAVWRPGSPIRNAYDNVSKTDTLENTIGWRSYISNMFITVPGEPDDTASTTDDGLVLWIQDELLLCADTSFETIKVLGDYTRLYRYIGHGECISYNGAYFCLLSDNFSRNSTHYLSKRYNGVEEFIAHRDNNGHYHVAFIFDSTLYWLLIKNVEKDEREEFIIRLDARWKWKTGGFLLDGKSLVLQALVFDGDVQTKVQVMKVDRTETGISFDYEGSFVSVSNCQDKGYGPYLSLFPALTTDGNNHISTIHFKYDGGAYCLTYLATYSENGLHLRDLDLSACGLARGWTYYLHLSNDGKTLLHCSLDTRLVKYNLISDQIDSVIHLPSEGINPIASPDNNYVLFDNREYHRDYKKHYIPVYNRLLCYANLSTADDYYDSGLTTLSADSKASVILTSFGNYYGVCAESATAYILSHKNVIRKPIPKKEMWSFSTAVAVTSDGKRFAYALGAGDFDSPEHWSYVIRDSEGRVYQTNGNVSMMQFSPDGETLYALVSHLAPTICHQFLVIHDGTVERINLHRMDAKDTTLCRGKYVSFKISPNGCHVLYCSDKYGKFSLGHLNVLNKEAKEIACDVNDYWWFADSSSFCFTLNQNGHTVVYGLENGKLKETTETAMAISPYGCQLVYRIKENGLRLRAKEIHIGEQIDQVLFCQDGIHCFIITTSAVFLVNWDTASIIQQFYLSYPDDISRKFFSGYWVAGSSSNEPPRRLWHHMRLYDKGLLLSDWDTLFRLEPGNGYRINKEVLTTLHMDGTYYCPLCGHLHRASNELIQKIKSINANRKCYDISLREWDSPFLREHKCDNCGVSLWFVPFFIA